MTKPKEEKKPVELIDRIIDDYFHYWAPPEKERREAFYRAIKNFLLKM